MTTRQDAMDRAGETGEVVFGCAPVAVATSDAERAAFEMWAKKRGNRLEKFGSALGIWTYEDDETQAAFVAWQARAALSIDFKQATDQGGTAALPAGWRLTLVGNRYVLQKPGEGSGVFDIEDSSVRVAVAAMFFRDLLAAAHTLLGVADGDAVGGKSGGAK